MEEINIGLINRLSNGLIKNVAVFEKAFVAANEAGIDTSGATVSKETVLATFIISNGDVEEMKKIASTGNSWGFTVFDAEANRVSQEMAAQAFVLRKSLGFEKRSEEFTPPEIKFIELRNLALAGLAVSTEAQPLPDAQADKHSHGR